MALTPVFIDVPDIHSLNLVNSRYNLAFPECSAKEVAFGSIPPNCARPHVLQSRHLPLTFSCRSLASSQSAPRSKPGRG